MADKSPLTVTIENCIHGFKLDDLKLGNDTYIKLAQHPNIVGTKLSCWRFENILIRSVALRTYVKTPSSEGSGFMVFADRCGDTFHAAQAEISGVIGLGANVSPNLAVRVSDLYAQGNEITLGVMWFSVHCGDSALTYWEVRGTREGLQMYSGNGEYLRAPMMKLTEK